MVLESKDFDGDGRLHTLLETIDKEVVDYYFTSIPASFWPFRIKSNESEECCLSWMTVSLALERFLKDPAKNYSPFVNLIEGEQKKFPVRGNYATHLRELFDLIRLGPHLSTELSYFANLKTKFTQRYTVKS